MDPFILFKRIVPRWLIFLNDIIIVTISLLFAYYLRFNFNIPKDFLNSLMYVLPIFLSVRSVSFLVTKIYAGILRFTSTRDALRIIFTLFFGSFFLIILNFIFYSYKQVFLIPFSIIIIDFTISTTLFVFERLFVKSMYFEFSNQNKQQSNAIIYGADDFGLATKRTIERDPSQNIKIEAFLDSQTHGNYIDQIPVYDVDEIEKVLDEHKISLLILSKKRRFPTVEKQIIDLCIEKSVKVLRTPQVQDWINGQLTINQIRNIKIEDLLGRDPIQLDERVVAQSIFDKTVLVTGAAGSIGSEIVRQLTRFSPKQVILLDQAESPLYDIEMELIEIIKFKHFETVIGDITDKVRMEKLFDVLRPQIVFHAAAYKHVPMMENNPYEAIKTNVLGTRTIADLSVKYKIEKFVMVSTDKAVRPTNVMGASKRIAEIYVQSSNNFNVTKFITTRFGNVLGSSGSVIPRFKMQIEEGGPVTVTHPEITRYFMTIPEACRLVLEAQAMGNGGEIFIFDMGKSIKIVDLAKKMIKLAGLQLGVDIEIKYTGLRPGEKLYEELLNDKENTLPTHHPQIMIAKVQEYEYILINKKIEELLQSLSGHINMEIVKKMKSIVPEFQSQNSIYEILDTKNEN